MNEKAADACRRHLTTANCRQMKNGGLADVILRAHCTDEGRLKAPQL